MRRYSVLRSAIKHNVGTTSKIHSALQEAAELAAVGATAAIGRILCQQRCGYSNAAQSLHVGSCCDNRSAGYQCCAGCDRERLLHHDWMAAQASG